MKTLLTALLFISCLKGMGQGADRYASCAYGKVNIEVCIPGQIDTIIRCRPAKAIDPALLVNDVELRLEDSSYTILSYNLVFDHDNSISEIVSTGSIIKPGQTGGVPFGNIVRAHLITIERIIVAKGKACYKIPPVILYCLGKIPANLSCD